MMHRREFLQSLAASAAAIPLIPSGLRAGSRATKAAYFGVHPFIESHPDAVFILRTGVSAQTDASAIAQAGRDFGSTVFVPLDSPGVPISNRVAIKANIVMYPSPDERWKGVVTDPAFVEGVVNSLQTLGVAGNQCFLRDGSTTADFTNSGYLDMAQRTGASLKETGEPIGTISEDDVQWVDLPSGKWFSKLPFLWPVNSPDTWLLNVAKFKTHLMGMTLCAKNLQGTIVAKYVEHCTHWDTDMDISADHIQPGAKELVETSYQQHVAQGIPRWDRPGREGGLRHETWATRCLDNNAVTKAGLHVIEAIYGREGPFWYGPSPDGLGVNHLTNMVVFGKNPFHVDNVGYWLGGHEPGNIGLFHMAIERGQASILNPMDIPVYEWKTDGTAVLTALTEFPRYQLRTQYLRRDYNDQAEDEWHLVNEPYDYPTLTSVAGGAGRPRSFGLSQNFPNPFNPITSIEFEIPHEGHVRLDIFDVNGHVVDVLADGYHPRGSHLLRWDGSRRASGVYFYRLLFDGGSAVKSMVLVR